MRHILHYIFYTGLYLACLPIVSQAESNFVKSLRTVLQHIPGATKILSMDLKSDVDGQLTAALSDSNNKVIVVVQNGTKWKVLQPAEDFKSQASIVLYDLDRDGKSELVIGSDRIRVYSLRSQQLDLLWESESLFGFDTPAPRVGFGDCNNDGATDLYLPLILRMTPLSRLRLRKQGDLRTEFPQLISTPMESTNWF